MRIGLIYTSISGNTKELALILYDQFKKRNLDVYLYTIEQFTCNRLDEFDAVVVGTYTWGNGEIPEEMMYLYREFEKINRSNMVTGIFGTGDSFYLHYCGAVDMFRDLLKVRTDLSVTLKVELLPQNQDLTRCEKFVDLILARLENLISH
ncbi:flavodoxin domain-containing protein [Bacillus sp. DTU_2020_1000418_1_SI_GHA_SEK_038]|uniref:flavodoxin domain-containing protein n=1 Tax=Bacillus sp. DTU_2020_1000418_1_SI_GHA_SEK_038 TaxID=3077585 RepID=UPI0028E5AF0B|nr:flavodoxin domain-containing protein [Bacillus sp. DTU_2020_1000418_1_SI_GHA_SEK_038]WNS73828.1 flavodoxin domain-containing protein [Bacillus sp. DTU_2020_1000418_1_SI_GHA_SEK_038]